MTNEGWKNSIEHKCRLVNDAIQTYSQKAELVDLRIEQQDKFLLDIEQQVRSDSNFAERFSNLELRVTNNQEMQE